MKNRFTTADVIAVVREVQGLLDLRVQNVYDVDSKTYLIKLHRSEAKAMLLLESGIRLHPTEFEWRKGHAPSSFAMKLRKHIKQKRLTAARQLGMDRIVDLCFGDDTAACHVIVELYDRGNVVLTDCDYTILNILRPRTDRDADVRFAVREKYPVERAVAAASVPDAAALQLLIQEAKPGDNLRKVLGPRVSFGAGLLEHCLRGVGLTPNAAVGKAVTVQDVPKLEAACSEGASLLQQLRDSPGRGYLLTKTETKPQHHLQGESGSPEALSTLVEFQPLLLRQFSDGCKGPEFAYRETDTFSQAVDAFFSSREEQKIDLKALAQEREALKKLDNIRRDHEQRLGDLRDAQRTDAEKAELIMANSALVERALLVVRSAVANQLSWAAIQELVEEGKEAGDATAAAIRSLSLKTNHITLELHDPYESDSESEGVAVEIDLGLGAHQNARRYYDHRRAATVKEQKTLQASEKALKSAEAKTLETLQAVQVRTVVQKQRKTYWFEKFFWFLSTDGYLVIGGRDATQNELLVKKYLRPGDVYVHADLRGASSVVVKGRGGAEAPIPPKTLHEAGTAAVCYSAAWEAKVTSGAWWVTASQVSKTAPSGEYLTAGSFMIRGKKNFLPPANLAMGFAFLFRLDEESVEQRKAAGASSFWVGVEASEVGEEEEDEATQDDDLSQHASDSDQEQSSAEEDEAFPDVQVELKHLKTPSQSVDAVKLFGYWLTLTSDRQIKS